MWAGVVVWQSCSHSGPFPTRTLSQSLIMANPSDSPELYCACQVSVALKRYQLMFHVFFVLLVASLQCHEDTLSALKVPLCVADCAVFASLVGAATMLGSVLKIAGQDDLGTQAKYEKLCDCAAKPGYSVHSSLPGNAWVSIKGAGTDDRQYKIAGKCVGPPTPTPVPTQPRVSVFAKKECMYVCYALP